MLNILSVNENEQQIEPMLQALRSRIDIKVVHAKSAKFALERIGFQEIDAVIVAEKLPDSSGKDFLEDLTKKNPFVASAMISAMDHDDFHEHTEGLGVLMQLPENPGHKEAAEFIEKLQEIDKIMAGV